MRLARSERNYIVPPGNVQQIFNLKDTCIVSATVNNQIVFKSYCVLYCVLEMQKCCQMSGSQVQEDE